MMINNFEFKFGEQIVKVTTGWGDTPVKSWTLDGVDSETVKKISASVHVSVEIAIKEQVKIKIAEAEAAEKEKQRQVVAAFEKAKSDLQAQVAPVFTGLPGSTEFALEVKSGTEFRINKGNVSVHCEKDDRLRSGYFGQKTDKTWKVEVSWNSHTRFKDLNKAIQYMIKKINEKLALEEAKKKAVQDEETKQASIKKNVQAQGLDLIKEDHGYYEHVRSGRYHSYVVNKARIVIVPGKDQYDDHVWLVGSINDAVTLINGVTITGKFTVEQFKQLGEFVKGLGLKASR